MESRSNLSEPSPGEGWVRHREPGLIALVGPLWEHQGNSPDEFRLGFLAEERHTNRGGFVHGGMLMTLIDHAIGMIVLNHNATESQATIQLDSHFMDIVYPGDFVIASSRVMRKTRSLIFMQGELHVGTRQVCTASGVWKLLRPS